MASPPQTSGSSLASDSSSTVIDNDTLVATEQSLLRDDHGLNGDREPPSETSPLLPPTELPPDLVLAAKSLRRRVLLMCLLTIFLVEIAESIMEAPLQAVMEDVICRGHYPDHTLGDRRCKDNDVQETLAMMQGWLLSVTMAVPMIAQLPYGIIADKYGRCTVLFLSLFGYTLHFAWNILVLRLPNVFPLWTILFASVFMLIGGGSSMVAAMVWTMVADVVPVTERTGVFYKLNAFLLCQTALAKPLSAFLIQIDPWFALWLALGSLIAGTLSTLMIPETLDLRRQADQAHRRRTASSSSSTRPSRPPKQGVLKNVWYSVTNDMTHIWTFIFRSKTIIVLTVGFSAFFPVRLAYNNIILQYLTKRFDWAWSKATLISTLGTIATIVALLIILPIASAIMDRRTSKGTLVRDLHLTRVSIVFVVLGNLLMTFAGVPWIAVGALMIYSLGAAFNTLCRALLNALVETHTLATLNTIISLIEMVMMLVTGPAMGWLLSQGMKLGGPWLGLPFLVMTGLSVGVAMAVFAFRLPPRHETTDED